MKAIMKVVQQGEPFAVPSLKAESGQVMKCSIVLQEIGGKYADEYVATMLGNLAMCQFAQGDVVVAVLHFTKREYNGQMYQDAVVTEIYKL